MTLHRLQRLQLLWVVLGLIYNAVSYRQIASGSSALAPTDPLAGAIFMGLCGGLIGAGMLGWRRSYRFGIPLLTVLLFYSGLWLHLMACSSDSSLPGYASFAAWLSAILINIYGVITLAIGGWLAWQEKADH